MLLDIAALAVVASYLGSITLSLLERMFPYVKPKPKPGPKLSVPVCSPPADPIYPEALSPLDAVIEELCSVSDHLNASNMMIAGGAVRDLLVGREPKDLDVYINIGHLEANRFTRLMGSTPSKVSKDMRSGFYDRYKGTHLVSMSWDMYSILYIDKLVLVCFELEDITEDTDREDLFKWEKKRYGGKTTEELGGFVFGHKVQGILCSHANTLEGILDEFDLDICMFGYNKERGLIRGSKSPSLEDFYAKMRGDIPVELGVTHDISHTEDRITRFKKRYNCDMSKASQALVELGGSPNGDVSVIMGYPNTLTRV